MSKIFSQDGAVAQVSDERPVRLFIEGYDAGKIMITKISGDVTPNYQLMYSLGADVFINAFNQKLSKWHLTGFHVPLVTCPPALEVTGFKKGEPAFVDLYRRFNIRTAEKPIDMNFCGIVLSGFFIQLTIHDYSQSGIDSFRWETPFLGRMVNLLEEPQPIIVEDAVPESPEAAEALRNGELDDVRSPVGDETGTEEVVVIA